MSHILNVYHSTSLFQCFNACLVVLMSHWYTVSRDSSRTSLFQLYSFYIISIPLCSVWHSVREQHSVRDKEGSNGTAKALGTRFQAALVRPVEGRTLDY
jgi:hypothetical protein